VLAALVGGSTSRRGRSSGPRRGGLESTGGYASTMNAVRGRVRGGHVEVDTVLPDGAEVVVFVPGVEPPFELSEEDSTELQDRLRELDRGGGTAAEEVFERLRPKG
ncbi:MAG TPA: hypothetical protein VIF09_14315, partial [Polyangiaceae bacterium]